MKTIWKWSLQEEQTALEMPKNASLLCVHEQCGLLQLWAEIDPRTADETEMRTFTVYGTGRAMPAHPGKYIGTAHVDGDVCHVYEDTAERPFGNRVSSDHSGIYD